MKLGLYGLHRGSSAEPDVLRTRAQRAEAAGFESLWVGDHIALPDDAPDPADEPRLEALMTLQFLASVTSSVRLGAGVIVLPQRQPVLLTKQLTSLDVLSGGRLLVGVGVGYVEAELRALGATLADRGAMTDEFIDAMHRLWAGDRRFDGRWVSFDGVSQSPSPVQRPRPPLVIGGHVRSALRRAARVGDGWFGWELDPAAARVAVDDLAAACAEIGRDAAEIEITVAVPPSLSPAAVDAYAVAGVHRLVLVPRTFDGAEIDDVIDAVAARLS